VTVAGDPPATGTGNLGDQLVDVQPAQKPYRRSLMRLWGAEVVPSPSPQTQAGRAILEKDPLCRVARHCNQ
jgi:hypothetical protein